MFNFQHVLHVNSRGHSSAGRPIKCQGTPRRRGVPTGSLILQQTRSFPKFPEEVRRLPKSSEVLARVQTRARSQCFSLQKSEIARKILSFIHFTHGFSFLHGSELTYFWTLSQARRQQLTFFNQACEIGPLAWAGVRSKFSTRGVRLTPKWELAGITFPLISLYCSTLPTEYFIAVKLCHIYGSQRQSLFPPFCPIQNGGGALAIVG